ncbi:hypothetical protein XENTR_v10001176 [Xenopus tropicalis]|nr:hypothetical protein XENTR_v10001176 [Xenopus tropicalis]
MCLKFTLSHKTTNITNKMVSILVFLSNCVLMLYNPESKLPTSHSPVGGNLLEIGFYMRVSKNHCIFFP